MGNPHFKEDSFDAERNGRRNDAGETATFAKKLEYVMNNLRERKYPDLRARDFLPVSHEVPNGAMSFTWRMYDYAGQAKIIANWADDIPLVDVIAGEKAQILQSLADGYVYSVQDLRASNMAGAQLDQKRAAAARRIMDNTVEQIAAFGDSAAGLPGFLNNPNVTILSSPTDLTGDWDDPTTTPTEILDDMNKIVRVQVEDSKQTFKPDTMLLPTNRFEIVSSRVMAPGTDSRTILKVFLENQVHIRNVDSWAMLDSADQAGTGPRVVCYSRTPDNVELIIPQEFEQFPPQAMNLVFKVPCHMRIGGVCVYYPLSMIYADGI
jgi:hypothetical protein